MAVAGKIIILFVKLFNSYSAVDMSIVKNDQPENRTIDVRNLLED
jgi:hypothetical protein